MNLEGFETLELVAGKIALTISHAGVSFSQAAIIALGKPEFVKVMINSETKQMAVQVTDSSDEARTIFLKKGKKNLAVRWNNSLLKETLSNLMKWDLKNKTYKVAGEYISSDKLLLFDLKRVKIN